MGKRIVFTFLSMLFWVFGATGEELSCVNDDNASILIKICTGRGIDTGGSIPGSFCTPDHQPVDADENGLVQVEIGLAIANLHPQPIYGEMYPLPLGKPPIYVEYIDVEGNQIVLGPIEEFQFKGEYQGLTSPWPVFEAKLYITLDFSTLCDKESTFAFSMGIMVTTGNGSLYPIHSHSQPFDIFSCEVFEETCEDCNYGTACPGNTDPVGVLPLCVYCHDEEIDDYNDMQVTTPSPFSLDTEIATAPVSVYPNPFSDAIEVKYNLNEASAVNIQVHASDGKLIRQWKSQAGKGWQKEEFSTDDLSPGIYYIDIRTDQYHSSQKIVKLE